MTFLRLCNTTELLGEHAYLSDTSLGSWLVTLIFSHLWTPVASFFEVYCFELHVQPHLLRGSQEKLYLHIGWSVSRKTNWHLFRKLWVLLQGLSLPDYSEQIKTYRSVNENLSWRFRHQTCRLEIWPWSIWTFSDSGNYNTLYQAFLDVSYM